jgi:hypothetical protein
MGRAKEVLVFGFVVLLGYLVITIGLVLILRFDIL